MTQNLAIAMRYLCHTEKASIFWIDAICIDQFNVDKRSRQVALMGDVFRLTKNSLLTTQQH